jgi:thiamine pyrophosphokinase
MSSHHIVRDNQEPALLVLNANKTSFDIIEELLEWNPAIIVHESEIDLFLLKGIKMDGVLFEENQRSEVFEKINNQLPVHLISYSSNLIERAFSFLKDKHHTFVNIITNNLDLLLPLTSSENPKNISVFYNNIRWSLIRSGHFEKWIPDGNVLILYDNGEQSQLTANNEGMIKVERSRSFWIGESLRD